MSKIFSKILIKKSNKKTIPNLVSGFTLIELLVVISLMALLSFIVLASLDNAREQGRDAQMQSLFASLRAKAEQYYSKYNTFGDVGGYNLCNSRIDGFLSPVGNNVGLIEQISDFSDSIYNLESETNGAYDHVSCHAKDDAWVVEAPLSDSKGTVPHMYCVDSTGYTTTKFSVLKGYTDFPGKGYSCGSDDNYLP